MSYEIPGKAITAMCAAGQTEWRHHGGGARETVQAQMDALYEAGFYVVEDSFTGLVKTAQAMLDEHYPADVFNGSSLDSGARFVHKLRDALSMVHADTPPTGEEKP